MAPFGRLLAVARDRCVDVVPNIALIQNMTRVVQDKWDNVVSNIPLGQLRSRYLCMTLCGLREIVLVVPNRRTAALFHQTWVRRISARLPCIVWGDTAVNVPGFTDLSVSVSQVPGYSSPFAQHHSWTIWCERCINYTHVFLTMGAYLSRLIGRCPIGQQVRRPNSMALSGSGFYRSS